jgi:hypothetical protein
VVRRSIVRISIALALVLAADACGGGGDDAGGSGPTTPPQPAAAALTLNGDGVGTFRFEEDAAAVTARLDAEFGPAKVDSYALDQAGGGLYKVLLGTPDDFANAYIFGYPALQIRCHTNGLCLVLGGTSASELDFTGWTYAKPSDRKGQPLDTELVYTSDGVTIGSVTTDFPDIVRRTSNRCYSSIGFANRASTINATFDDYSETGPPEPAPGTPLAIVSMNAGDITTYADGCA